jgi:taurine dioxygenase
VTNVLSTSTEVTITRLAGNIGAVIGGVDTTRPLGDETVATVRKALLDNKVIFFRDQNLDYDSQRAFAERLGDLTRSHPIYEAPDQRPALREMDSAHGTKANHWHTDLTFIERPPAFCLLHAKIIPPLGGDTMWANCASAYQTLPEPLRKLADELRIVHSNDCDFTDDTVDHRSDYIATAYEADQPAVRVHPETGERSLLLGGFARSVVGYPPQAGRDLIRVLQEYVTRPEQTVRWQWRVGDLAIWDNQSTMHYAIHDYGTQRRRGERLTTIGPAPVGIDGRAARTVAGDTSAYSSGI